MTETAPWKIWANPIFRRYLRSRLRPQGLGVGVILTLMVAGFLFFGIRTVAMYRGNMESVDAERLPLVALGVVQVLILFFLGTGQVAGGMTGEADEGVLDYQRLTPLTPLTKVFGYLFGLPLREYVMFACTLPFTAWGLWRGQVPFSAWASVYLVLFSSTLLYHLTGLVAGTVVKNRRWAFLVSIAIVFGLYTVMPQVAKFGLTTFKYFTVWPVVEEQLQHFLPRDAGQIFGAVQRMSPQVGFFGLNFSETVFTLFSQAGLILTFVVMLWRRWRQSESHLLGKVWAVGLLGWTQVMLLGNALPLIAPGWIFPSREFQRRVFNTRGWTPSISEGMAMIGLFGLVALLMVLTLTSIITPTLDGQVRGRRRARKLGLPRPPWFSDAATGFWFVLAMAIAGAASWFLFARALITSSWYAGHALPAYTPWAFLLVMLTATLSFHALLEAWGARRVFFAVIFIGVAPIMVGATLAAANDSLITAGLWIIGLSPLAAPIFASQAVLPALELPLSAAYAIPPAFWFWQSLAAVATVSLVAILRKHKRAALALLVFGATVAGVGTPAAHAARVTDEEVGQWAVTVGGFVTTDAAGMVSQTIEATGLPAGKYSVISLAFPSLAKVTEADLARVGQLKRLGYLEIKNASDLTAAGMAAACQAAPLGTLLMHTVPLADADLACLGRVKTLRTLDIRQAPKLTGTVWREWKNLPLNRLAIGGWSYSPGALAALADIKSVQSLTLDSINGLTAEEFAKNIKFSVPDIELAHLPALRGSLRTVLAAFPRAASVRLTGQTLDPADLEIVAQFKPMTFLQLAGTGTGDAEVAAIARSSTLATLHWFHFASPGVSLDALAACKSLRQLALTDSQLTDAGLRQLATLTQVERLLLDGNPALTDDGLSALAAMKQLRTLRLSRTPVTDAALTPLTALRRLESLELVACPGITAQGISAFRKALPKCQVVGPQP